MSSADRLTRAYPTDLEVRSEARTIIGIAVPFDVEADVGRFVEVFRRGAFARTISERGDKVKLLALHDGTSRLPVGRATVLREDTAGLYAEFRVSRTTQGDEVLALVGDGALDALSIGFSPVRDTWDAGHAKVERHEVRLHEVSVVAFGAYKDARIVAVRNAPTPTTALLRRRLDLYGATR